MVFRGLVMLASIFLLYYGGMVQMFGLILGLMWAVSYEIIKPGEEL